MAKSTAVSRAKVGGLPVDASQAMSAEVEALKNRIAAPSGDKIKIKNKQFILPNGDTSDMITVCIVDFAYYNAWYPGQYDENNIVPPDCFAINPIPTELVPSPNSLDKQDEKCVSCWANQFNSRGKGKACRNSISAAVLAPGDDVESPMYLLNISPTGLRPFAAFVNTLARTHNLPPFGVFVDVVCDPNVDYPSLRFSNPVPIDADFYGVVNARRAEARERLLVEPDMSGAGGGAEPATPARGKGRAAAPAPARGARGGGGGSRRKA